MLKMAANLMDRILARGKFYVARAGWNHDFVKGRESRSISNSYADP